MAERVVRITDGKEWVMVTRGEAAKLREDLFITPYPDSDRLNEVHHLLDVNWHQLEQRLAEIRRA